MPIIGSKITDVRIKIDPREGDKLEGIQVTPSITHIKEEKINNTPVLAINCSLLVSYVGTENRPLGSFVIAEEIIFQGDKKDIKEVLKEWTDNKQLPKNIEKDLIETLTSVCMYDLQFFTNRMRFPP